MVFSFPIAGYAATPDSNTVLPTEITVETVFSSGEKLYDPSKLVRTPDPDRTYYTAQQTNNYRVNGVIVYTLTGRYIWSVETLNPTAATLAIDNIILVSDEAYISAIGGVRSEEVIGGKNDVFISGYIKSTIISDYGYDFWQIFTGYPDGSYYINPNQNIWGSNKK